MNVLQGDKGESLHTVPSPKHMDEYSPCLHQWKPPACQELGAALWMSENQKCNGITKKKYQHGFLKPVLSQKQ